MDDNTLGTVVGVGGILLGELAGLNWVYADVRRCWGNNAFEGGGTIDDGLN